MNVKHYFLFLLLASSTLFSNAQNIEYNKKKNVFEVSEKPIAKFDAKSIGNGKGRSFFVTNLEDVPYLDIRLRALDDTLFAETYYWYAIDSKPLDLHFTIANPAEINGEKYFSKFILEKKLLNADGSLNAENMKQWASENTFDYQAGFDHFNDSLKALLAIEHKIENRRNGDIVADRMGRIGQGNVVIGKWEKISKKERFGTGMIDLYIIKNNLGRVVATLNTEFNATLLTFGKKRLSTTGISEKGLMRATGESDESFMSRVANVVVREGVL